MVSPGSPGREYWTEKSASRENRCCRLQFVYSQESGEETVKYLPHLQNNPHQLFDI